MKHKIKQTLMTIVGLFLSTTTFAHNFEVDGIYYNLMYSSETCAAVTYKGDDVNSYSDEYTGDITIPLTVEYNGRTYPVTKISENAFSGCASLTSITIPKSVIYIEDAFSDCISLCKLTFKDGPDLIISTDSLFSDCPIEELYLGRMFYSGPSFSNSQTLKSVTIGDHVTDVGYYKDCSNLATITIGNSATYIGRETFCGCTSLTSITIPNSVTKIDEWAFRDCSGLTEVNISDLSSWCKIDFGSFDANPLNYAETLKLNGVELSKLDIPNDITEIKNYAFYHCKGLTSVTIPNSVTKIGDSAFDRCTRLTEVTIPNSVTEIDRTAFSNCSNLTEVTIGNSVTSIGDDAFYNCTNLSKVNILDLSAWCNINFDSDRTNPLYYARKLYLNEIEINNLVIPNDITKINKNAFYNCSSITTISIPNSVTSIGYQAFMSCSNLKSISIGNSVNSIDSRAFFACNSLTEVNISDLSGWCKIDFKEFLANPLYYAETLKLNGVELRKLDIPNDITEIKNYAFYNCKGLTSVTIPNSVTKIGYSAFNGCTRLTEVTIPNSVTSIGNHAFYDCSSLTSATIPNSVTKIGEKAFYNCSNLTEINIFNVSKIEQETFSNCNRLSSVVLGKSIEHIGNSAFYHTSNLKKIITLNPTPPTCVNSNSFYNSNYSNTTLYVPKDSYAKYFIDDVWGQFSNIQKIETLVSSINLNQSSAELKKGDSITLSTTITPTNATLTDVVWNSSNPSVAVVDQSGKITALSAGNATITATAIDGSDATATCTVTVCSVDTKITLSQTEANIFVNDIITLTYSVTPSTIPIEWSTSDANIAYIKKNSDNSLTVVGVSDGIATITATALDDSGASASCLVTVGKEPQISLSQTEANLNVDDIIILSYSISNSPIQTATWTTSDEKIAKIKVNSNGTVAVIGVSIGTATITATLTHPSGAKFAATCEVSVGSSGIDNIEVKTIEITRYDIHGRLLSEPTRGVNIVKYNDGSTRKEVIK